jgi:hypothetical protein
LWESKTEQEENATGTWILILLKMKKGDIRARISDDLTAVVWRDKRDDHILTNIHNPPVEGNFEMNMVMS